MRQRKLPDRNPNHPGWQGLFIGFIWVSALFSKAFVPLLVYLNNWNFPASHTMRLQQHPVHSAQPAPPAPCLCAWRQTEGGRKILQCWSPWECTLKQRYRVCSVPESEIKTTLACTGSICSSCTATRPILLPSRGADVWVFISKQASAFPHNAVVSHQVTQTQAEKKEPALTSLQEQEAGLRDPEIPPHPAICWIPCKLSKLNKI